jgi:hypothetical protein
LTLLQYHGKKLGVIVDRTPKCHPEIAGEGIEYLWGVAKMIYRTFSLVAKKGSEKFLDSVRACTSRDNLNVDLVRKCSKRARRYMLAYQAFNDMNKNCNNNQEQEQEDDNDDKLSLSYKLIEKAVKSYKCHRSAMDTDAKFISTLKEMNGKEKSLVQKVVKKMSEISAHVK